MAKSKTAGAPRGNQNATKAATEKRPTTTVRLSQSQRAALGAIGGTTSGLGSLLNAAAGAVPVVRVFKVADCAHYAVWLDAAGIKHETEAGAVDEYGARLVAAHEWLTQLAHANHMAMRATR